MKGTGDGSAVRNSKDRSSVPSIQPGWQLQPHRILCPLLDSLGIHTHVHIPKPRQLLRNTESSASIPFAVKASTRSCSLRGSSGQNTLVKGKVGEELKNGVSDLSEKLQLYKNGKLGITQLLWQEKLFLHNFLLINKIHCRGKRGRMDCDKIACLFYVENYLLLSVV